MPQISHSPALKFVAITLLIELEDSKVEFLHTLNGSGVATPRLMVALIETYQTEKGTVFFPDDVAEFLGIQEIS